MNLNALLTKALASKGRGAIESVLADAGLDDADCDEILHDWEGVWARPTFQREDGTFGGQLPPADVDWDTWLLLAGRGYGKTRTGAEWVRKEVKRQVLRFAFIAQDPGDARQVMIYGDSGIMAVCSDAERPTYNPSLKLLNFPNGSQASVYSAHDPDALRGPQFHRHWGDELASWKHAEETWDNLAFGLRLVAPDGSQPRGVITTTPKPMKLLKEIMQDTGTRITTGSTYDNIANLAAGFIRKVVRKYEGTALGAQELYARLLDEVSGALWDRAVLEAHRRRLKDKPKNGFMRVVVAVDPMARATENARRRVAPPETGIIVCAVDDDGHGYVLADLSVENAKPSVWAPRVIEAFHEYEADRVVAEVNNGGDMVEDVIMTRDKSIPVKMVHASRGKRTRAEPISSLYYQGQVHHLGHFAALEDQLCTWTGADGEPSPDRLDAAVWGLTDLMIGSGDHGTVDVDTELGRTEDPWSNR